jgi:mono/diheme cytochrome c family protein
MRFGFIALSLSLVASTAAAEDFDAKSFLAEKCSSCHGTEVYSRPNPRVKSLDKLAVQVRRCDANVGTGLFDEDIDAVVKYLNVNFYKF